MCGYAHEISLQLDLDSGMIEALKQSPVRLRDMDPGLKHRVVGSGATSKAMALHSLIIFIKWSSNVAASLSEVTLSMNKQVKGQLDRYCQDTGCCASTNNWGHGMLFIMPHPFHEYAQQPMSTWFDCGVKLNKCSSNMALSKQAQSNTVPLIGEKPHHPLSFKFPKHELGRRT